jgi:hypothetical protein
MDTTIHTSIFHKFVKSYDDKTYPINNTIKSIMFNNIDYLSNLNKSNKSRPTVLENVERTILCGSVFLGYNLYECPNCKKESLMPRRCHSRFCNSCGIKYAKQLAAKTSSFCLNTVHRHIVFTIPQELRNWFLQDRSRLDLLFIASRNTISSLVNDKLYRKTKKLGLKNTRYLYKNYRGAKDFGMIATLHTFGRDLKWNPHIHSLVPEMIYDKKNDIITPFTHFNYPKLRKTFMFELLRLIDEEVDYSFYKEKSELYRKYKDGFYVYAKPMEEFEEFSKKDHSKNINACISYCMRYAARPAMAESRIDNYDIDKQTVTWHYTDHKTDELIVVCDDVIDFIHKLIIHIPDKYFNCVRYYGFYANAASSTLDRVHLLLGMKQKKDFRKAERKAKRNRALNKLKYRTHLIDSFQRDPLKCSCGHYMRIIYIFNPLEGISNDGIFRKNCINEMQKMQIPRAGPSMGTGRTRKLRC